MQEKLGFYWWILFDLKEGPFCSNFFWRKSISVPPQIIGVSSMMDLMLLPSSWEYPSTFFFCHDWVLIGFFSYIFCLSIDFSLWNGIFTCPTWLVFFFLCHQFKISQLMVEVACLSYLCHKSLQLWYQPI